MKKLIFLIFLLAIFSCTTVKKNYKSEFFVEKNLKIQTESYTEFKPKFKDFIPILSLFLPRSYYNFEKISIYNNEELIEEKNFKNLMIIKSVFLCNSDYYSCVQEIKEET